MPFLVLDALPVGDYLVLTLLFAGFLLYGVVRLVAYLMRQTPDDRREREHYADKTDSP